jgi:hypothetical protein
MLMLIVRMMNPERQRVIVICTWMPFTFGGVGNGSVFWALAKPAKARQRRR